MTLMHESPELKVVPVGLGVGQSLLFTREPWASFHFPDGGGVMVVGAEEVDVAAGGDGRRPDGRLARVRATSRLVFPGSLGEPGASKEDGPH